MKSRETLFFSIYFFKFSVLIDMQYYICQEHNRDTGCVKD